MIEILDFDALMKAINMLVDLMNEFMEAVNSKDYEKVGRFVCAWMEVSNKE